MVNPGDVRPTIAVLTLATAERAQGRANDGLDLSNRDRWLGRGSDARHHRRAGFGRLSFRSFLLAAASHRGTILAETGCCGSGGQAQRTGQQLILCAVRLLPIVFLACAAAFCQEVPPHIAGESLTMSCRAGSCGRFATPTPSNRKY
jgi:hypothetical protein